MVLPTVFKTRSRRCFCSALLVLAIVFSGQVFFSALNLNLAYLGLMHWSPLIPYDRGTYILEHTINLGERAGPRWLEHGHGHRARQLMAQMASDEWHDRFQRWQAFDMGRRLETQGHFEVAIAAYREAAERVELRIPSFYALYQLTRLSDPETSERYLHRLSVLEPATHVHWAVSDHYKLLGFDIDDWSIAWEETQIPITLYWQVSSGIESPRRWQVGEWEYIQVRDRVYQMGLVSNLLPNGGFEQDLSTLGPLPIGYQNIRDYRLRKVSEITDFLLQYHRLFLDQRNGYLSQVAAVTGPPEQSNGFSAPKVPIEDSNLYLLSGWMRTTGESEGYLAGVWEKGRTEFQYWKIADWSTQISWRQYAEVAMSPSEADRFRFIALQRGSGEVVFDNVLFCQLQLPDFDNAGH